MLRSTKRFQPLQVYRPNRQTIVTDTDVAAQHAHQIAQTVFAPAIQKKSKNAILTDRIAIKYYQEMLVGRLCSCFKKEYDAPEAGCLVCFGVGRVGGFNLYGTYLDVIDTTKEGLSSLNIYIDDNVWPWEFKLCEGSLSGFVDATIDVPSMYKVDVLKLYSTGKYFKITVRKLNDTAWHPLNRQILQSIASAEKRLVIRIALSRKNIADTSPSFTHLYIRYLVLNRTLYTDMPKLGEFKNVDNFALTGLQTTQAFFSAHLPSVQVNDVFKDLRHNVLWRINEVTKNNPLGVLTSWDVDVRSITSFEIYNQIP